MMGGCPHVPTVFTSTLKCTGNDSSASVKTATAQMRALPVDTSIPGPDVDAHRARVTLRVALLENTISDTRSEGVACVFNTTDLSPVIDEALVETVWPGRSPASS